jgi:4-amino-4-deoxy-L-arabinose transferase-like glycosyltransferase
MSKKHVLMLLLVFIAVSVVFRCAAAVYQGNDVVDTPGAADQISYHNLALRILEGKGFSFATNWWPATDGGAPTAHWSYLYTFYLVIVYSVFGEFPLAARLIQAILAGALQPLLIYFLTTRLFGAGAGLAAAGLTAFYTYFIYYGATLMTEPFYMITILLSLLLAVILVDRVNEDDSFIRSRSFRSSSLKPVWMPFLLAAALGLSLTAAILLRQLFMLFVPILFLWMWWAMKRRNLSVLITSGAIIIAAILPFTLYNYSRFDRFVLLNTNAGFAFFWGNHPIHGTKFIPIFPSEVYNSLIPDKYRSLDEAALDQALLKEGLEFIREDPIRYGLLSLSRIPVFFTFWPTADSGLISNFSRITSIGLLLPFMLYGLALSFSQKRRTSESLFSSPVFLLYLFIAFYTLIHILSWALIRYRLPVDAVLLIFAGLAFLEIFRFLRVRVQVSSRNVRVSRS